MYNINDKITQSVAGAVRRVMENKEDFKPHMMYDPKTGKGYEAKTHEDHLKFKDMGYTHEKNETEVQDSDKDFVDTHSVDAKEDPEQKRQVEETEAEDEDDVEEGNAFGQAVTDAKKAGKKKFTFQGKEYKVESADLEEDADLKEAAMSQGVKRAATQIYSLEKSLKAGSNLNKGVNKSLEGKYDADFKKMQKAIGDIVSVWEEIERDFAMNESTDLEEASNADLKKVLATTKKLGAIVKGNTADFGQGAVIDFSIEKGKIKFDGGMSSGVEYFKNVKDAISALMIGFDE